MPVRLKPLIPWAVAAGGVICPVTMGLAAAAPKDGPWGDIGLCVTGLLLLAGAAYALHTEWPWSAKVLWLIGYPVCWGFIALVVGLQSACAAGNGCV